MFAYRRLNSMMRSLIMTRRFSRLDETARSPVQLLIDGRPAQALAGDTLMVAMLSNVRQLRDSEFGDGKRAGFCLMGACQDCWVWTADGERLRACTTVVAEGMHIVTTQPEGTWLKLA
jgi:aerobic-type carbon monoxide dehydrogenase small subunit (CoxS/CutS family)